MKEQWWLDEVIAFCTELEAFAPDYGCHIGLTGGLLYKDGLRKDADILIYRIRQIEKIDTEGLFRAMWERMGVERDQGLGWCIKATWRNRRIDFFFPEEDGEYPTTDADSRRDDRPADKELAF